MRKRAVYEIKAGVCWVVYGTNIHVPSAYCHTSLVQPQLVQTSWGGQQPPTIEDGILCSSSDGRHHNLCLLFAECHIRRESWAALLVSGWKLMCGEPERFVARVSVLEQSTEQPEPNWEQAPQRTSKAQSRLLSNSGGREMNSILIMSSCCPW